MQIAYAIGVADPVSIMVDTYGTGTVDDEKLGDAVKAVFSCRPAALIEELDLLNPIYQKTAAYGHFGRNDVEFSWERTDKVEALKSYLG